MMFKTKKTKKLALIGLFTAVALVLVTAVFYIYSQNSTNEQNPENTIKEVKAEEDVKAEDVPEVQNEGPREYISKYYQEKNRFNAIGIKWEEVSAGEGDIEVYLRIKDKGTETEWLKVTKNLLKEEKGIRYYSAEDPILARGDEYQYKVTFAQKDNEIRNVQFNVINTMGTVYSRFMDKISSVVSGEAQAAVWRPSSIIPRSQWGGSSVNVSSSLWPPEHAEKTSKFIVHHTAGVNKTCVASTLTVSSQDVKAIWSYHTYGNDWGDIGYNYLVDPCGRVFEGRLGGNNVIAGHASPYNYWDKNTKDGIIDEASVGVSVLGNYSSYAPSSAIIESLGRIIGYKSYINGVNPTGATVFKDTAKPNISGHRDYTSTTCPGSALEGRLSNVRGAALAHKNLYIAAYGNYENISQNIYLNKARITMEDASTPDPDDYLLASNPSIGEPITVISALKNTGSSTANLKNVKIMGVLDTGKEFVIGSTPLLTIGAGATKNIPNATYNINSYRYQTYKITYELEVDDLNGSTITVKKEPRLASSSFSYPSLIPHFPKLRVTSGPLVSPTNPAINVPATLSYSLRNYDARPSYLRYVYVNIQNSGSISNSTVAVPPVVNPGTTYNYSKSATFSQAGVITLKPIYVYANGSIVQGKNTGGNYAYSTVQVANIPIDYNKISLNSFKVTMEDPTTVSTTDYLLAKDPAIGEPVRIKATLKNTNATAVALTNVRIRGVLDSGTQFTVKTIPSLTLTASGNTGIPSGVFNISSFRVHSFYIDYVAGGKLRKPIVSSSYSYQKIVAHFPNLKVVKTPVFTPNIKLVMSRMYGTYKLKNYDHRPAYLRSVRLGFKTGGYLYYFKSVSQKINPSTVYEYNMGVVPGRGGTYYGFAQVTYANGSIIIPYSLSSVSSASVFKVYTEVATLGGITIPATSGRVAREQHLDLIANETASHHYSTTPVASSPSWLRNGMAGGAGAFGSYGYAPKAEEKYYITMRWKYATWYSGSLGNASQMYCGSAYSYYSINYYNSYKYNGQYCVPKTYTKNASSNLKASHWKMRVVVTNPANGRKVVVSVLESGPAIWTGRVAGLSPEAMLALGISSSTNSNSPLKYYWAADQSMALGRIK